MSQILSRTLPKDLHNFDRIDTFPIHLLVFPHPFSFLNYLIMPIVDLSSYRKKEDSDSDDNKKLNEYFSGGISSQGGGRFVSMLTF